MQARSFSPWLALSALTIAVAALLLPALAQGAVAEAPTPSCAEGPVDVAGTVYGTPCADTIVAPPSVADVKGGGGDDVIVPAVNLASEPCPEGCRLGVGSQTFEGGPGDDIVYGERGNDRLFGGGGNDRLYGGIGDDLLRGGPGNDLLSGGFGADSIDGEEGSDYVRGDGTQDTIVDTGTSGDDTLSYSTGIAPGFFEHDLAFEEGLPGRGERGVYLDLAVAGAETENGDDGIASFGGGVDKVEGAAFETIVGTPFSDYILGGEKGETIFGGGGADVILGGGGNDTLHGGRDGDYLDGGEGDDSIDGGPGSDRCLSPGSGAGTESCERSAGGVVPRSAGGVSVGSMTPGEGAYAQLFAIGSEASDEIAATYEAGTPPTVGFDLTSSASFDLGDLSESGCEKPSADRVVCPLDRPLDSLVVAGMGGDDVLIADGFPESVGVVLLGGEGSDRVVGGEASEDVLVDGPEAEGPGNDVLEALGGDDALLHNGGEDRLYGGAGNDLFLSNSICDGEVLDGGPDRDNASWAKLQGPGVVARLDRGRAGGLGAGIEPECDTGALDALTGVEDLEGSGGTDVLYGDDGDNQLLGWEGEDVYSAGGGEDRILANSGDYDPQIECGEGNDTAFIDFPVLEPHDVAAPDCEQVHEAAKNSFRIETELEAPSPEPPVESRPEEPTRPPKREPRPPKGGTGGSIAAACVDAMRLDSNANTARCGVRPRRLVLGGRGVVKRIRWTLWGTRRAVGFGRLVARDRAGRLTARAQVLLSRPERCRARPWYTRIRVLYGRAYRRAYLLRGATTPTPCTARLRRGGHGGGTGR